MTTPKDFDPITGKLVDVSKLQAEQDATFTGGESSQRIVSPSPMANPLALAPTGSPPGKWHAADVFRALMTLFASYGGLQLVVQALQFFGTHPSQLGKYGTEIAAVSMFVAHLIISRQADNTPRVQ